MLGEDFFSDYLHFQSGNDCPQAYHFWSAYSIIANAVGPRVWFRLGGEDAYAQLTFYLNMYIALVGEMGNRKSFARDVAIKTLLKAIPDTTVSGSVDSVRSITKELAKPEAKREFINDKGEVITYTPYYQSIDEIINYVSIDPARMVNFWVAIFNLVDDIYKHKISGLEKENQVDVVQRPFLNMLACGTTDFVIDLLKDARAAGGLARRFVMVLNEDPISRDNPEPKVPLGGREAEARCIAHLQKLTNLYGEFRWATPEDNRQYHAWYKGVKNPMDQLMRGFYSSKHVYGFKLAMCNALSKYNPKLVITIKDYMDAIALIETAEPGMAKLFRLTGRNELATPMQRLMDYVEGAVYRHNGSDVSGVMPKNYLMKLVQGDFAPLELFHVLRHLRESGQVLELKIGDEPYILTREGAKQLLLKKG